jgi:hypothetical protein
MPVKEVIIWSILLIYSLVAAIILECWIKEEWGGLRTWEKYVSVISIMFFWLAIAIFAVIVKLIEKIRGEN